MQTLDDLKFSIRLLRKTPVFTAITVLITVLGLSLHIVSSTLTRAMSDQPMPFPDGERYVTLKTIDAATGVDNGTSNFDSYSYNQLRSQVQSYDVLGAFIETSFVLNGGEYARTYIGSRIDPEVLAATSVIPVSGRNLSIADSFNSNDPVVLISHALWQEYYAGADIIGQVSQINGDPHTIIGVMPEGFNFPTISDLWIPLSTNSAALPGEGDALSLIGVLTSEATTATAEIELNAIMQQLAGTYPDLYSNRSELVLPFASIFTPVTFGLSRNMNFMTIVILLLATTNLSSLLFMRASAREQELAVRSTLGANGWELAKQALMESFLICFFGSLASLLVSGYLLAFFRNQYFAASGAMPMWFELSLSPYAITTGGVLMFVIWILAGLWAAIRAYQSQSENTLNSANKGTSKPSGSTGFKFIVGIEVVVSFFLLICCGVMFYLMERIVNADFGVVTEDYVVSSFSLVQSQYEEKSSQIAFIENFQQALSSISEIGEVVVTSAPPGLLGLTGFYEIEERQTAANQRAPEYRSVWVNPGYFEALNIPVLQGREFDRSDSENSESVAIISEEFARELWPQSSPIGKTIQSTVNERSETVSVVGVISGLMQSPFGSEITIQPSLYRPLTQSSPNTFYVMAELDSLVTLSELEESIRTTAAQIDREVSLAQVQTLSRVIVSRQGNVDLIARIFAGFSIVTLVLAAIGIYGVIARSVYQRTHEIGVRRALGSSNSSISFRFLKQGAYFLIAGLVLGGGAASLSVSLAGAALSPVVNVQQYLPGIIFIVFALMCTLILTSSYLPVRRAVAMEPGDALRYE